jgi:hypothetical protein
LNSEKIWKIQKKCKLNSEKIGKRFERILRNNEKKIWNIWKKRMLNSEKIGKIWKKIVKRYEKYGKKEN